MSTDPKSCYINRVVRVLPVVTKTLTFNEETEVLGAVYTAVAYYKLMAKSSVDNTTYWNDRAEQIHKIADKLNQEMRNDAYGVDPNA